MSHQMISSLADTFNLVDNLATHLNNEPHRPRNGDLQTGTLQRWIEALDTGIPDQLIRLLAPLVMCQMITYRPAALEQARHDVSKAFSRHDEPVVVNKWVRYYDVPDSNNASVNREPSAHGATDNDTAEKKEIQDKPGQEETQDATKEVDEHESPADPEDEHEVGDDVASEDSTSSDGKIYCICGKEASGNMIACDNKHVKCAKEWFHLKCVYLTKAPPSRFQWYCPECRVSTGKGIDSYGVVRSKAGD